METDALGRPLFDDRSFHHSALIYEDQPINIVTTGGLKWLYAADALSAAGVPQEKSGGYSKTIGRLSDVDKIKIAETAFTFGDGRKDKGWLVSPRSISDLQHKTKRGRNPIKTTAFLEWLAEGPLEGHPTEHWSPAKPEPQAPVFREVKLGHDEDGDKPFIPDPMRPLGLYKHTNDKRRLRSDEVQFCLCQSKVCGCDIIELTPYFGPYNEDDCPVVDDYDDLSPDTAWTAVWSKKLHHDVRADFFKHADLGSFGLNQDRPDVMTRRPAFYGSACVEFTDEGPTDRVILGATP